MSDLETYSANVGKDKTYNYIETQGFELRFGKTNSSTYNAIKPEDHLFELRIRHKDPEQVNVLLEKIKEWLQS